jgi:XTP/dITP diphosphohydrolase
VSRLLVATTNAGKQREFRRLLAHLPAELVMPEELGLELEIDEPHDTYAENAAVKAAAFARAARIPAVADDSGIEVAALAWGPGVRSARWAGERGREADRLLDALDGEVDRRARMVCVLAVATPADADPVDVAVFHGAVEGTVATERRGQGGFGYDPVFIVAGGRTTAELPEDEKDRLSHRGRAVSAATPYLKEVLARH